MDLEGAENVPNENSSAQFTDIISRSGVRVDSICFANHDGLNIEPIIKMGILFFCADHSRPIIERTVGIRKAGQKENTLAFIIYA
jgi:hypothetical protein